MLHPQLLLIGTRSCDLLTFTSAITDWTQINTCPKLGPLDSFSQEYGIGSGKISKDQAQIECTIFWDKKCSKHLIEAGQ